METIYIALVLLVLTAYFISQSVRERTDPKTTAFVAAVVFALVIVLTKPSALWVFFYIALALITTIIVSYWVSLNVLSFNEKGEKFYEVPYWVPVFFAQAFLVLHVLYQFIAEQQWFESYD